MNFIEANTILKNFEGGSLLPIHLAISGNADPILLYIKAFAALKGEKAEITTLPFGTLGQALLQPADKTKQELLILFPWDLVTECDWRSGIPAHAPPVNSLLNRAKEKLKQLLNRGSKIYYIPAAVPPMYMQRSSTALLMRELMGIIASNGIEILDKDLFSLGNYLASGVPFAGSCMGNLAKTIIEDCLLKKPVASKVLITDLDNVLWAGLAAEEGPDGIKCQPDGKGFRHFLYQTHLIKLKSNGILLAAVSRNDLDIALAPIKQGSTLLKESDFIDILASYEPKSLHIKRLAAKLNLNIDSFVFIDDNPIELAEVSKSLPAIKCIQFPPHDDQLAVFFDEVSSLFARDIISVEDKERTEMYRRRMELNDYLALNEEGGDLREFLLGLRMELTIYNRGDGPRERAVQLINKTNQFNLNGERLNDDSIAMMLADGGKLYTAILDDRGGTHGEILACLIDKDKNIRSFVMSCRVFQREIEFAFTCWLVQKIGNELKFDYRFSERNTPVRNFLTDQSFKQIENIFELNAKSFLKNHEAKLDLFKIKEVGFD
jgi:FkbH-like protein